MTHDSKVLVEMEQFFQIKRVKNFRGFDANGNWVIGSNKYCAYTFDDHILLIFEDGVVELLFCGERVYFHRPFK
jgi:hypothetical protein